ncbi:minor allergen Can f 2-like [Cynocephalus volans]|uniref:minor allergen Can f 2-like n=1 Tax=Cynocephalus volans TaxID=110931 RepID=UPI002FCBA7BA
MHLLLLTVGLALVCGLWAHEEQESDLSKLSGSWYISALASNNSALIAPGGHFRVFINTLNTEDGNLLGDILVPEEGGCSKVSLVAFKTEDDDRQFTMEFWGHNELHLEEVVPSEFLVLYLINLYEGETSLVANLLVRKPVAEKEFLDTFEDICEELGLLKEQIVFLDQTDRCEKFRD